MAKLLRIIALLALALTCQAASADEDRIQQVYNNVFVGDYETAVSRTKELQRYGRGHLINQVVQRLIKNGVRNTLEYAYKLWSLEARDIVRERFPIQFRMIIAGNNVKLINHRDNLALKLGEAVDDMGDRIAYGDANDKSSNKISWKFTPLWEDQRTYFKIANVKLNQYLKLGANADDDGEYLVYGASGTDSFRHQWYLQPASLNGELVFYILNREYHQALKLGRHLDSMGDRQAYSEKSGVDGSPQLFGWYISAF
ncbi:hypothetical protein O3G_MSEX007197 [Manduca sexta]|uniref:Microvitellogenin n=1 Tax=Manduca sexta TaxID=7130 RepID=A0A922CMM4_MANSE|nr:hypothetical protein O3G_MSEX007197 [Manduca sexta]